ncbi:cleavage and polyadenylation specificity factor subunit 2, partial [Tremellales sp. Uapishka_1]
MITLTPLSSSAASSSSSEPVCYLLELDEARILLDMGQRDYRASSLQRDWEYEAKVRELAPSLSLVLLSHSQTTYLGLYPFARAHWNLTCPVYATQPTVEMGRVVCLAEAEMWRGECLVEDVEPEEMGKGPFVPTIEEIHEAFDWIKPIRYNQPQHLGGNLSHLLLTPFPSGHTLGGTLFKLRSPTSGTVLYAVGINHTGERHLDGMVGGQGGSGYAEGVMRPDLLIIEGGQSLVKNPKRRERESALIDLVSKTLESNHSLLLPCDPSPRLLELLVLLDQHWSFRLTRSPDQWKYPLCVVSRTAQDMLAFARSLIEWMGGVVRDNPGGEAVESGNQRGKRKRGRRTGGAMGSEYGALDFSHVQLFATPRDLLDAYPMTRPKLILAVPPTLSHGPSRFLFTLIASTPGNVIVLTSRGEKGTLTRKLYEEWTKDQDESARWGNGGIGTIAPVVEPLAIEMNSKVPLAGSELEAHLESERLVKEREAAQQAALDRSKRMLEADDLESDSDSESEVDDAVLIPTHRAEGANAYAGDGEDVRTMSFDIFVKGQQTRLGRGEGEMARFRMFPFLERRGRKVDAYGEGLDIGQWVRKGREIEEEGETEEVREAKRRKLEEEEKQKVPPEPPSKFVKEDVTIDVRADVFFVDMEGLHDGQAIKTIISDLQPRKLILVRSSADATNALLHFFKSTTVTPDIYAPRLEERITIGEHVQSYSIMLGDSVSSGLLSKLSKFEGYEVAMVDGKIVFSPGSTVPKLESANYVISHIKEIKDEEPVEAQAPAEGDIMVKPEPESSPDPQPEAKPLPSRTPQNRNPSILPSSLFVGDLRLTTLKSRLASIGVPAEFAGEGILICGPGVSGGGGKGIVAIRKIGEGQVVLEGAVGKSYFLVRKELYKSFAQVVV